MASPVFKFPEIVKNIYSQSGINEITTERLRKEIMMVTGFYKQTTITEVFKVMQELGFIKETPNGFIIISFDGRKMLPEHEKRLEKEIKKELKEFGEDK